MSWIETTIGQLGKVVTGKTPPTKNRAMYDGEYMFVTPTDLDWQSYYVRNTHSTVTELARDGHKNQFIPAETTVFTCIGNTIGKCGLTSGACLSNQQINSVVPNADHDSKFVYYLLNHNRPKIRSIGLSGGSAQPIINKSTFSAVKVTVPDSKVEQKRIASVLSAYDDLIENNRRRIALLEEAARLIYREWFVHLRFPGHEHVKIIDGVPEGWKRKPISEIWSISYGKNLPTAKITEEGEYPVHGADGIIGYYSAKNVDENLCLVTCRGNGSGNVRRTFGPTFVTNNCFVFRPLHMPRELSFHFAINTMTQLNLRDLRTGAAQPQLTLAGISHVQALVPNSQLLSGYNALVDPIFEQADNLRKQNAQLAKARDLLLPRLMDGRLEI